MKLIEQVKEFYLRYQLPQSAVPSLYTDRRQLRKDLLSEEFEEYMLAEATNDVVEIADALGDMLYIIAGTALEYGIPLEAVFDEIHRSNMSKADGLIGPLTREDGKILKGPHFTPPDIEGVLRAASKA